MSVLVTHEAPMRAKTFFTLFTKRHKSYTTRLWIFLSVMKMEIYEDGPSVSQLRTMFGGGLEKDGKCQGEDRTGPALNPLKGSSARLPPSSMNMHTTGHS